MPGLLLSVSFDDIDSRFWGCTTHLAGLFLVEASHLPRVRLADYPLLVRLNPAIPWKTRGNAAVVARLWVDGEDAAWDTCGLAESLAWEYTAPRVGEPEKQPGVACVLGRPWESRVARALYSRALTDVVTVDEALRVAWRIGARVAGGRGRIGAVSALAALAPGDPYTYELTAYRHPSMWGERRCVDHEAAAKVEAAVPPCVFNNYDPQRGRLTAAPGGPDPVLAGFRGTCPEWLGAYSTVLCEEPHFWVLYRSNQHTDAHARPLGPPRPYKTGVAKAVVESDPRVAAGGHVFVRARLEGGASVELAFYKETGPLNRAARLLRAGDSITVLANVRPYSPHGIPLLTVEKMLVQRVAASRIRASPRCPRCGHRMKRTGRGGHYKCPRCGYKAPLSPLVIPEPRLMGPGVYTPGEGRLRHLTAPPWLSIPILESLEGPEWGMATSTSANPPVQHPPASTGAH
ncbi:MAG: tRNA(Ile)(2)-agmatinylcytidine synthase [Desulfurococcales archaeon]|nr:tRNA(Ile)(2)-agmatinylcytidine synthase [Desulfurococcales archaeon]